MAKDILSVIHVKVKDSICTLLRVQFYSVFFELVMLCVILLLIQNESM